MHDGQKQYFDNLIQIKTDAIDALTRQFLKTDQTVERFDFRVLTLESKTEKIPEQDAFFLRRLH